MLGLGWSWSHNKSHTDEIYVLVTKLNLTKFYWRGFRHASELTNKDIIVDLAIILQEVLEEMKVRTTFPWHHPLT